MAEAFTSYLVDNDRRFRDALTAASGVIEDFRIPFGQILRDFYRSEQAIFTLKSPGKYDDFRSGGAQSKYAIAKQKAVGFKYPLLVRSGRMAASLLGPNNPGSVAQIGQSSLSFGTSIPYTIYHQSDEPRKEIPLRKVLFIGPEATQFANSDQAGRLQRWLGYIDNHVVQTLNKAALGEVT